MSFRLSFLALGAVLFALPAHAQSFPNPPANATPFWVPMTRGGNPVIDPANGNADARDIVGDATHPAAFLASDAGFLYLRVRVNGNPGAAEDRGFGCLVDTDATLTTYEYLASYDGNGTDTVRYLQNTTAGTANTANNDAETVLSTFPVTSHGRVTATGDAVFSSNADYFVDLAVPWAAIRVGSVTSATALRFICGTTTDATSANDLGADIFDNGASIALQNAWTDAYTCNSGGNPRCVTATDPDGDGVQNAAETTFGTNPNSVDSDGDGLPDFAELTSNPLLYSLGAVNTDSDARIDALDTDSDNDCVPDATEGLAAYRNEALPNPVSNLACSGARPICNEDNGSCSACNGDRGSVGTTLPCYDPTKPYCDPSGRCSECTATRLAACTAVRPACETSTGVCSACNGDRGTASSAACPVVLQPACNRTGPLAGTCTQCSATNASLCPTNAPACSAALGTCAQCTGDSGDPAASAACPNPNIPACNATGPFRGRCTVCSASNTSRCAVDRPTCDTNNGVCAPCDGDHNGGTLLGCPRADAPTCALAGANRGQCAKCTTSADCGAGHLGPTCNVATGACEDVDTDGDGIQDEVEDILGTDKTKRDTDGDGIDDRTEVTPQGGGSFAKVDSDSDGTIDALDTDSDNDGLLDRDEGATTAALDTDRDNIPDFRDADDDGDGIDTAQELADTRVAAVAEDVDGDGTRNWVDSDANGNGILDGIDTRADDDGDRIPNYLDAKKDDPDRNDAGGPVDAGASSSSSSGTSGTPVPRRDGGSAPDATPDDGVLEGSGCNQTGASGSALSFALGLVVAGLARRRRASERR